MKRILSTAAAAVLLVACSKEKAPVPDYSNVVLTKKIKKVTYAYSNGTAKTETCQYDVKGRIKDVITSTLHFVFDYSTSGKLTVERTDLASGKMDYKYNCDLNPGGNVVKLEIENPVGTLSGTYYYQYNSDGFIVTERYEPVFGLGYKNDYTFSNGNATGYTQTRSDGVLINTSTYTYDPSVPNTFNYNYASYFPGTMFGKMCKNAQTEFVQKNAAGTITFHTKRTFDVLSQGYVLKDKVVYPLTGFSYERTYEYE